MRSLPPAPLLISSPYDPEARYGTKRETEWTGYKVHGTETCDDETPNLITDVTTTASVASRRDQLQAGGRMVCGNTPRPDTTLGVCCARCLGGMCWNVGLPATS